MSPHKSEGKQGEKSQKEGSTKLEEGKKDMVIERGEKEKHSSREEEEEWPFFFVTARKTRGGGNEKRSLSITRP